MAVSPEFRARMDELLKSNHVVLFMKGNRRMPQCGFSARVVGMLDSVIDDYATVAASCTRRSAWSSRRSLRRT
jgi:monothiol glutaredoxin